VRVHVKVSEVHRISAPHSPDRSMGFAREF
jgi:hypothetical protein